MTIIPWRRGVLIMLGVALLAAALAASLPDKPYQR